MALKVYDICGREVTTLVDAVMAPGKLQAKFNGMELPTGLYLYSLQTKNSHAICKMLLVE